jgi:hypothetical protein
MKRFTLFALLAITLAIGLGVGCYTMIRHPETDVTTGDMTDTADRTCADCHSDADYYHWTDPYYTSFYSYYPSTWGSYYLHPWWYGKDWYPGSSSPGQGLVEPDGRHAWDRGPGSADVPSIGGTQIRSGSGDGAKSTPAVVDTSRSHRSEVKEQPKAREEKKRNAWGR